MGARTDAVTCPRSPCWIQAELDSPPRPLTPWEGGRREIFPRGSSDDQRGFGDRAPWEVEQRNWKSSRDSCHRL